MKYFKKLKIENGKEVELQYFMPIQCAIAIMENRTED